MSTTKFIVRFGSVSTSSCLLFPSFYNLRVEIFLIEAGEEGKVFRLPERRAAMMMSKKTT